MLTNEQNWMATIRTIQSASVWMEIFYHMYWNSIVLREISSGNRKIRKLVGKNKRSDNEHSPKSNSSNEWDASLSHRGAKHSIIIMLLFRFPCALKRSICLHIFIMIITSLCVRAVSNTTDFFHLILDTISGFDCLCALKVGVILKIFDFSGRRFHLTS